MNQTKNKPNGSLPKTKIDEIISKIKGTEYFQQAFTHRSFCHENNLPASASYENLEFFGDSILNFYTSEYIYHSSPHFSEGQMSKLKQLMVQERTLATLSKEIGFFNYLRLGTGEENNKGRQKVSILADIFESFVAALYLEKGGMNVKRFLRLTLFTWIKGKENTVWDYKSQLQEYCQAQKQKNEAIYRQKEVEKGKGQQLFVMEVRDRLGKLFCEVGTGKSKKEAEQKAAEKVIKKLGIDKSSF